MSKKNTDFFKAKKIWSEIKDELLGCYFKPYVMKILKTYKPLVYIDCFAGKGKFDDGKNGSPLIALEILDDCKEKTKMESVKIKTYFIDLNHADDLKRNLTNHSVTEIISGKYEDNIDNLLQDKQGCNVFLYIDPYGINALQCAMFEKFANSKFNTIELLINMNSFGFVREACHALGAEYNDVDIDLFDDLVEYDPTKLTASEKAKKQLTDIAGGDYWIKIIDDYKAKKYDGYQAEILFSEQYCCRLMQSYKYVLNMPLRLKQGQRPKYRMIHATNHEDGCVLMTENINKRWEALQEIQTDGQLSLFTQDAENQIISIDEIENKIKEHISTYKNHTSINIILAEFFSKFGATICTPADVREILSKFEKSNIINVDRNPPTTDKGRPSTFLAQTSKHKVQIRSSI